MSEYVYYPWKRPLIEAVKRFKYETHPGVLEAITAQRKAKEAAESERVSQAEADGSGT